MNVFFKASAIAAATASLATAAPAMAQPYGRDSYESRHQVSREDYRRGYRNDYRGRDTYRDSYHDSRVWRGDNGRYYCRRSDGTTGLLVGGAAGALIGRGIDGGRDRTLGTLLGAVGGALLGREVDRGGSSCR